MRLKVIAAGFLFLALLSIAAVYLDEAVFAGLIVASTVLGIYLAGALALRLYVYSGVLLAFHVVMAAFAAWVFVNRDRVIDEQEFVFAVFIDPNLQLAVVTLISACIAVLLPWLALARGRDTILRASGHEISYQLLGQLQRLPLVWFQLALFGSLGLAVLFFLTNASVLEISYPFLVSTHWVPGEIMKIPTLLAATALAFAYVRHGWGGGGFARWLLFAKCNFLSVTVLMLLLAGSRGLFTFLWLIVGFLELLLWYKRRGSLGWALLFVGLAWLAYQAWPGMRWYLSLLPLDEVLTEALQISLGFGDAQSSEYAVYDEIRLGAIPMIGASLFHLLYAIELIQNGVSLGGSTFVNLIPQVLPDWLDGVLWERPLNDNLRLAEYFYHGGGFLIVANAYWNGGFWVAMGFMSSLSSLFVAADRYYVSQRVGVAYTLVYWLWLPLFIVQLGYGIQGTARIIELLFGVMLFEWSLRQYRVRRSRAVIADRWGQASIGLAGREAGK